MPPPSLASLKPLMYESAMLSRRAQTVSRSAAFAGETLRALSNAILLLGLIGDRRAR